MAIAASALAHAVVLLAVFLLVPQADVSRPVFVLPISLVSRAGGGSDGGDGGAATAASVPPEIPPEVEPPRAVEKPAPMPTPVIRRKTVSPRKQAPEAATLAGITRPEGNGDGGSTASGVGGGGGSGGGSGTSAARPGYGVNPQPPYPIAARRLGLEGTVVLRVVVSADGTPASVVVLQSSGHAVLDASALETVRTRWRFVPARRNGIPVEDTVQVPIRFRQTTG